MAMSSATLTTQLTALPLTTDEPTAISAWAAAFDVYMKEAEANAIQINAAGLVNSVSDMEAAMVGLSGADLGAVKLRDGMIAYWLAIIPASAWATCTAIGAPATLGGMVAGLRAVFASNLAGELSQADAAAAVAVYLHSVNVPGGTATFPGPSVLPIT